MDIQKSIKHIDKILALGPTFFKHDSWLHKEGRSEAYFDEIVNEVAEAKEEFRKDNAVYLEDELGDIFWDYVMLLQTLKLNGYIRSVENVFAHAEEKFTQRLGFIHEDGDVDSEQYWDMIKKKQKEQLKKEHDLEYTHKENNIT